MLLDFRQLRDGRSLQIFETAPEDVLLEGFFGRLTRPLATRAQIQEQPHQVYLVELRLETEVEQPCRRCLTPVRQRIDERARLVFEVTHDPAVLAAAAEEVDVFALRSPYEKADIGPSVREALFLAAENFPVCSETCRGLCPQCGEDLNAADCGCVVQVRESRWEKLRDLTL